MHYYNRNVQTNQCYFKKCILLNVVLVHYIIAYRIYLCILYTHTHTHAFYIIDQFAYWQNPCLFFRRSQSGTFIKNRCSCSVNEVQMKKDEEKKLWHLLFFFCGWENTLHWVLLIKSKNPNLPRFLATQMSLFWSIYS